MSGFIHIPVNELYSGFRMTAININHIVSVYAENNRGNIQTHITLTRGEWTTPLSLGDVLSRIDKIINK